MIDDDDHEPTVTVTSYSPPGVAALRPLLDRGDRVGTRFSVTSRLGGGGSGDVYAASDLLLEEDVALKALRASVTDIDALRRLRDEVRAARRIGHPNVCRVHDLYSADGILYLVMELLLGPTLRQRLRDGRLPATEALEILRQLGAGLAAAHRAGVIHCDVKPENAMLVGSRVVITDFGIARMAGGAHRSTVELEGTPAYMSPEQVAGTAVDERADVYALATIAAELLLHAHPFVRGREASFAALAGRIAGEDPWLPEPSGIEPARRAALLAALRRGLAKRPGDRFESVDALVSAIVAAVGVGAAAPARVEAVAGGARRVATVVHVQVEEREGADEERTAARIETVLDAATAAVEDAVGLVVARLPRALVAVFGAATTGGDEPRRAGDAARAIAQANTDDVAVKVALDTGRVLVWAGMGVTGEPLARAASLAAAGAPGEVRASQRTARHLWGRFELEPQGDAVRVGARRPVGTARLLPFVGRDAELAQAAEELLAAARTGRPRAVIVVGEPGIGKSRFRHELVDVVRWRMPFRVVEVSMTPAGAPAPWSLLRAQLASILDLGDHPDPVEAAAGARRLIPDDSDGALGAVLEALLLGRGDVPAGIAAAAARAALVSTARRQPLLLVVDDLHWADQATLEVYRSLPALPVPIALIGTARVVPPQLSFARILPLLPLLPEHAQALAAACLGDAQGTDAARALAEVTDGNPFYIEVLARDFLERGDDGATLPSTLEEAIQARLDRLSPGARAVLRAASVLGRTFRREELLRLGGADPDAPLAELESRRLVFPRASAEDIYVIQHALIRDVAYRELPAATRRSLHAAAVRGLEDAEGERTRDDLERLSDIARHHDGAENSAAAVASYRRAGQLARSLGAPADALRCFSRAAELSEGAPDPELLLGLGLAALDSGHLLEADRALDATIARTEHDPARRDVAARAFHARAEAEKQRARWHEAAALLRRGLACAGDAPALAARLHGSLGWVLGYSLGERDAGLAEARLAVDLLDGTGHHAELALAYSMLGAAYMRMGRWQDQLRCNRETLELGERIGSIEMRARAHLNLGVNLQSLGRLEESLAHSRTALDLYTRMAAPVTMGLCRNNLAVALVELGRLDEAERELDEALRVSELSGGLYYQCEAEITRARLLRRRGELDRARQVAAAVARGQGTLTDEGMARRVLGALLSQAGEHEAAEHELDAAEKLLAGVDMGEAARVVAERARAARRRGDAEAAARLFAEAAVKLAALDAALDLRELSNLEWI